jgi:hypothetical protein
MHDQEKSAEQYIRELLGISENLKIESMVAVGYPAESKAPHPKKDLQYEKVHYDRYGKSL